MRLRLSLFVFRVDDLKYHEHDHEQVTNSNKFKGVSEKKLRISRRNFF